MKKIDLLLGNEAKIEFAQQGKNCKSEEKGQKANPYNLRRKKQAETGENIPRVNKTCEELKRAQKNDESLRKLYKQVDKPHNHQRETDRASNYGLYRPFTKNEVGKSVLIDNNVRKF